MLSLIGIIEACVHVDGFVQVHAILKLIPVSESKTQTYVRELLMHITYI